MSTFSGTVPSTIPLTSGHWSATGGWPSDPYMLATTHADGSASTWNTSSEAHYVPQRPFGTPVSGSYHIIFKVVGTNVELDVQDGTDGIAEPLIFSIGATSTAASGVSSGVVTPGQEIKLWNHTAGQNPSTLYGVFTVPTAFGVSSGPIGTLSGGSSPEIKDIAFIKVTDSIVFLSFNWQNLNTAHLFVDSGGTTPSQTNIPLGGLGQSGTISGSGYLTNLNEGDRCWIANTDVEYIHRKVVWSVGDVSGVKSVIAKTFAYDTGQSFDLMFYSVRTQNPAGTAVDYTPNITHDGTLQTASLPYERGRTYKMLNFTEDAYGSPYIVNKIGVVSGNFW